MKNLNMQESGSKPYWVVGLLAFITLILFFNSWNNPFILDDLVKIVHNSDLRNIDRMADTLIYPYADGANRNRNDPSRPLIYLIYTVVYYFAAARPFLYHIVNTVVHFANGVLVYFLFNVFWKNKFAALIGALLFLVLPLQAGVAIYVYALSDLLFSFFVLLAFYLYLQGRTDQKVQFQDWWGLNSWLVILSYLLALASKQIAVVLILILALFELTYPKVNPISPLNGRNRNKKDLASMESAQDQDSTRKFLDRVVQIFMPLGPLIAVTLLYIVSRYLYLGGVGDIEGFSQIQKPFNYVSVQGFSFLRYIQLSLIPVGLTIDHGVLPEAYSTSLLVASWILVIVTVGLGTKFILGVSPASKNMGYGILFYFCAVLPTSIFPTVDCLVERRAYFANFGLLLIVAGLLVGKNNKELKVWKKYSAIALLVVYFGISFHRNEVFASERKIWEESLSSYPGYSRAMINTAWCLVMDQEYERGEEILKSVNHYMPLNTEVLAKLGTLYTMIGFKNRDSYIALNYFQRAVEINSDYYIGRFLTAELLMNLGRYPEAKDMLQKAIHTNPNYGAAYLLLGKIAEAEKDFGLAQQLAAKAHEIDPAGNLY